MNTSENYYVTAERLVELKEELRDLKTVKRQEIAERLKRAKEYGDLSENSEYSDAKEQQTRVETRIFELEDLLKRTTVIKKGSSSDVIDMGSTVTVQKDGKAYTYQIVGTNETKPEEGKISNESPLGSAFFGRKTGEDVTIRTPRGSVVYHIIKVE